MIRYFSDSYMTRPKTKALYSQLCQMIPGGVNSPVRACKNVGEMPLIIDYGYGDTIHDVDRHAYIDFCGSWGALIHGHAHPVIQEAVIKRMSKGTSFGITTEIEERLASKVLSLVPSLKKIRFVSSGTEATMTALRLARGYTGRDTIIKFSGHYHGHSDYLLVQAGSGVSMLPSASSAGVPQDFVKHTMCLPFNDVEACRKIFRNPGMNVQIAAVILEPIAGNMGVVPADKEFMQMLREETERIGALLIFDEVITGFRVALGGAQALYEITPDLSCFGKVIGGGFPVAAFGGRQDIMDCLAPLGKVYQAGTLSGNPVAMEAGLQALQLLEVDGFYEELERKTSLLVNPIRDFLEKSSVNACIQQVGSMFTLFFGRRQVKNVEEARQLDLERFSQFFRFMLSKGIYIPPLQQEAWFISMAHEEDNLFYARDTILDFFKQ